jgi:triacylglycerol lipase
MKHSNSEKPPTEVAAFVDPEIELLLEGYSEIDWNEHSLPEIRRQPATVRERALSDDVERTDYLVPGNSGVIVRVHRPKGVAGLLPCIYAIHGGGYVSKDRSYFDPRFDVWCPRLSCAGASVEYRLAPENPYPSALEDCYSGLVWLFNNAHEIGIDRERIGVMGSSAGGGLAAALALYVRDHSELSLLFQLLLYPELDDRQITPSSRTETPLWSLASNEFAWKSYLGDLYGRPDVPIYAAPARALDLSELPPGYIMVGTFDRFLDESVSFAQRLNQAGVPTDLHIYPGATHGFDAIFSSTTVARQARKDMGIWVEQQFNRN